LRGGMDLRGWMDDNGQRAGGGVVRTVELCDNRAPASGGRGE